MAEAMKQTQMLSSRAVSHRGQQDFPRLLDEVGADHEGRLRPLRADRRYPGGHVGDRGDADMFPPAHAVEMFALLGGGRRDGGWDGSGRPKSRLAILPGLTHYAIGAAPELSTVAIGFLDERSTQSE